MRVTCLCPGFTRTEFGERAGMEGAAVPDAVWMTADAVAEAGLDALDRNAAVCIPGRHNAAMVGLLHVLPRGAVRKLSGRVTGKL